MQFVQARSRMKRTTVVDALVGAIRTMVLDGRLQPGAMVTEQGIADEFKVARPTAKAAIERLVETGLLSRTSNKPAIVPVLRPDDVDDLVTMLAVLLSGAVRALFQRADTETRVPAEAPLHDEHLPTWAALTQEISGSLGSRRLTRALDAITTELRFAEILSGSPSTTDRSALMTFTQAMAGRDEAMAVDCVRALIEDLRRRLSGA